MDLNAAWTELEGMTEWCRMSDVTEKLLLHDTAPYQPSVHTSYLSETMELAPTSLPEMDLRWQPKSILRSTLISSA